jgi:rhamnose utilization protein RhaD (predicted bifunctional aldolase and dehydrogenase)
MSVVDDLIARSNRLGADPATTNYAGGNTSAQGSPPTCSGSRGPAVTWAR